MLIIEFVMIAVLLTFQWSTVEKPTNRYLFQLLLFSTFVLIGKVSFKVI